MLKFSSLIFILEMLTNNTLERSVLVNNDYKVNWRLQAPLANMAKAFYTSFYELN